MPVIAEAQILKGRKVVDAYRASHAQLYLGSWNKDIPAQHTPLLEKLVLDAEVDGFISIKPDFISRKDEILATFFDASEELNMKQLGFKDRKDFERRAKPEDWAKLEEMWK